MSAEDLLAVSMLVMLALAGVTLMTIFHSLVKNAGKRDELEELLAEATAEEVFEDAAEEQEEGAQAWEKGADWWRE